MPRSPSQPGHLALSVRSSSRCRHFIVGRSARGAGRFSIGTEAFPTLQLLVQHYESRPIAVEDSGRELRLVRPLPRPPVSTVD